MPTKRKPKRKVAKRQVKRKAGAVKKKVKRKGAKRKAKSKEAGWLFSGGKDKKTGRKTVGLFGLIKRFMNWHKSRGRDKNIQYGGPRHLN